MVKTKTLNVSLIKRLCDMKTGQTSELFQGEADSGARRGTGSNPNKIPAENPLPRLAYSVRESAEMLGVCEKTIRRLISRGLICPNKALRHLLIPKKEIERFLEESSPQ